MEGGRYVGPLLKIALENLIGGRRGRSGVGSVIGSGVKGRCAVQIIVDAGDGGHGGSVTGWVCYEVHLPTLYLWYGENSCTILVGTVLHTVQEHFFQELVPAKNVLRVL